MITQINIPFTPCPDVPVGGYSIEYRVVGDTTYIDGGLHTTSPAVISVSYPDGTQFEGVVHSPCGDVVWSTEGSVDPGGGCTCRFAYPGEDDTAGENRSFDATGDPTYRLTIEGVNTGGLSAPLLDVHTSGANGTAVAGRSDSGAGIYGNGGFFGGYFVGGVNGVYSESAVVPFDGNNLDTNPSSVVQGLSLRKNGTYTGADGVGISIIFGANNNVPSLSTIGEFQAVLQSVVATLETGAYILKLLGAGAYNTAFTLSGLGEVAFPLGLIEYADDTAAAAGTPVIPIGGLYRTGSVVKIRVT